MFLLTVYMTNMIVGTHHRCPVVISSSNPMLFSHDYRHHLCILYALWQDSQVCLISLHFRIPQSSYPDQYVGHQIRFPPWKDKQKWLLRSSRADKTEFLSVRVRLLDAAFLCGNVTQSSPPSIFRLHAATSLNRIYHDHSLLPQPVTVR